LALDLFLEQNLLLTARDRFHSEPRRSKKTQ
jgi:hypothetical protein